MACYEYRLVVMKSDHTTPKEVNLNNGMPTLRCTVKHMCKELPKWGLEGWAIVSDIAFNSGSREMFLMREIETMKPEAAALEI